MRISRKKILTSARKFDEFGDRYLIKNRKLAIGPAYQHPHIITSFISVTSVLIFQYFNKFIRML